jgi:hypothetical protein
MASNLATSDLVVCYGNAQPDDTYLAATVHCMDGELVAWLERRERRREKKKLERQCRSR